jgi:arginine exporter protein ArgO
VQRLMGTIGQPLRWLAAAVLVGLATRTVVFAVRRFRSPRPASEAQHDPAGGSQERPRASLTHVGASPWRTYAMLVGLTAVNPSTVATFGAIVVGHRLTGSPLWLAATGFALAAFAASAAWQLTLVTGGSVLGRLLSGPRGQLAVASVSALLMVALAVASLAR